MFRWLLILLVLLVPSFALAQGVDLSMLDLANPMQFLNTLAASPLTLGFLVFGVVASIKRAAENAAPPMIYKPLLWRTLAFVTGLSVALLLHALTGGAVLVTTGWGGAVLFGLLAGLLAILGRDGAKTAVNWRASAVQSGPVTPVIVGDVTPPAGVIDAPSLPVAPSGVEPLPTVHGLLGLPSLNLNSVIDGIIGSAFKGAVPDGFPGAFALRLAPIIPELLDGDLYLSADGRNRILDVVLDAKAGL